MRVVEPSFEILAMPDGAEALGLLERIGRVAYKSEDKIERGELCLRCCGDGRLLRSMPHDRCPQCGGSGMAKEPSSFKFVRMIIKAERKAKLIQMTRDALDGVTVNVEEMAEPIVEQILAYMEQNPAHESVIEHCSATVLFTSNRGFTHELVRHRLCAFTQESTRYCNYSKDKYGNEITICPDRTPELEPENAQLWALGIKATEQSYIGMTAEGEHKVKAQIARDVLPQVTKADIVCTANFREWKHIFRMRCSPAAHPDMRALMLPLREEFRKRVPIIFD